MKRKVLGKGIEAIITNKPSITKEGGYIEIDIDNIYPNPFQPRKEFKSDKIDELAKSIKENGLIQPIVVYKEDGRFYLLVGERRWRSVQKLKWKKIPAVIKDLTSKDIMIGALVENIQREDLNAIEIAEAINQIIAKHNLKQEEAAEKIGMSRTTIANFLRLLKLPEIIKKSIISGDLTQGHARALLGLEKEELILSSYHIVLKKKLSVRETEKLVTEQKRNKPIDNNNKSEKIIDPDLVRAEDRLSKFLSTKVNLQYKKGKGGKITIFFNDLEEYDRIYKKFIRE